MNSINFEILHSQWPKSAGLGGFSETYSRSALIASLAKLQSFCEQIFTWNSYNEVVHDEVRPRKILARLKNLERILG